MTMPSVLNLLGLTLLVVGLLTLTMSVVFVVFGRDLFFRIQSAGMTVAPGVAVVLLAAVGTHDLEIVARAVLVLGFLVSTTVVSAHTIARLAFRRGEMEGD